MKYCRYSSSEGEQFGLIETVAGTEQITSLLQQTEDGLPDLLHPQKIAAQSLASVRLLAPIRREPLDAGPDGGRPIPAAGADQPAAVDAVLLGPGPLRHAGAAAGDAIQGPAGEPPRPAGGVGPSR